MIKYFKRNSPKSRALAFRDRVYVHKSKGFKVSSRMSTDKHVITYYFKENYTVPITTNKPFWRVFAY